MTVKLDRFIGRLRNQNRNVQRDVASADDREQSFAVREIDRSAVTTDEIRFVRQLASTSNGLPERFGKPDQ
jgi:hypothetical protein